MTYSNCSVFGIRFGKQVFRLESRNMAGIARDVLVTHSMVRPSYPVYSVSALVPIDVLQDLIPRGFRLFTTLVELQLVGAPHWQVKLFWPSCCFFNELVDVSLGHGDLVVFVGNMACVPWQVHFIVGLLEPLLRFHQIKT
jgi:hypothetical protein